MRRRTLATAFAALCLVPALSAWTTALRDVAPTSRIWIKGTSTVRSFKCTADSLTTRLDTEDTQTPAGVLAGKKVVRGLEVVVAAQRMNCHNDKMNEHMMKALKADQFPRIVFRLDNYTIAQHDSGATLTANGSLTLGGVQKAIVVTGESTADAAGAIRVIGSYDIRLSDFNLKAPSLFLGTMRVGDVVTVGFDLHLGPNPEVATVALAR